MEIVELSAKEYGQIFDKPYHVYNGVAFNQLNAPKAEQVCYLAFKDSKWRLGLIAGINQGQLLSPFSAPFGGFQYLQTDVKIAHVEESIRQLDQWATGKGLHTVKIVLPPDAYHETFIVKQFNALLRAGYQLAYADINYQFPLAGNTPLDRFWSSAKYHYRKSMACGLTFRELSLQDLPTAYEIIAANRANKGFPLRMSLEQLQQTSNVVRMDVFAVYLAEQPIAAAIVYRVADQSAQVVYWGDLTGYSECRPMHFMANNVFTFYGSQSFRMTDTGTATEYGTPNHGLCEFKESIGCAMSNRFTFAKSLNGNTA